MSRYVKAYSRTVHKVFDKNHKNVLRNIRELIEEVDLSNERTGAFNLLKFEE